MHLKACNKTCDPVTKLFKMNMMNAVIDDSSIDIKNSGNDDENIVCSRNMNIQTKNRAYIRSLFADPLDFVVKVLLCHCKIYNNLSI